MIARIRGEHDARWGRWRPTKARETADVPARQTALVVDRQSGSDAPRRRVLWSSLIGVSVAVGCLTAIWWLSPARRAPRCQRRREHGWMPTRPQRSTTRPE